MIRDPLEGIKEETGQELTIPEVAKGLGTTPKTLATILNEHQGISSEMAIHLPESFGSTAEFWLKLQQDFDLWETDPKD
jgi:antitoxin HigA-1